MAVSYSELDYFSNSRSGSVATCKYSEPEPNLVWINGLIRLWLCVLNDPGDPSICVHTYQYWFQNILIWTSYYCKNLIVEIFPVEDIYPLKLHYQIHSFSKKENDNISGTRNIGPLDQTPSVLHQKWFANHGYIGPSANITFLHKGTVIQMVLLCP